MPVNSTTISFVIYSLCHHLWSSNILMLFCPVSLTYWYFDLSGIKVIQDLFWLDNMHLQYVWSAFMGISRCNPMTKYMSSSLNHCDQQISMYVAKIILMPWIDAKCTFVKETNWKGHFKIYLSTSITLAYFHAALLMNFCFRSCFDFSK